MSKRNIGFEDGWYGKYHKVKDDFIFVPCGKATELVELCEDIQTDKVFLKLCCNYLGKPKSAYIERGSLTQPATAEFLADLGFDVTKKNFDCFVESILAQEDDLDSQNIAPTPVYSNLGWIELPDEDGKKNLFYRAETLIGASEGKYIGNFDVRKCGTFEGWKAMIEQEVLGHDVLELVVIASLSAVTNGLIAPQTNGENPIIHLNVASGKGKSTAEYAGCSVIGRPFDGVITEVDTDGVFHEYTSVYQSWGATDNAIITSQAGNRGMVTILNELGKNFSTNMARLIFDLSEGSDKKRLTTTLKQRISERYTTVFISTGESSLLDRCSQKLEGLAVRVLELKEKITDSAEHSNRIKEACREHCGHAVPMLAQHIIEHGGVSYVLPIYKRWLKTLREDFPATPNKDRFVEKFAALFLTTAEISRDALGIAFDLNRLTAFLREHEEQHGDERNVALLSYQKIVDECLVHKNNFYRPGCEAPTGKIHGRFCKRKKLLSSDKQAVGEILVRKPFLEEILQKHGFPNINTCKVAWKDACVLNCDGDRPTRSRHIEDGEPTEDVFCFWLFDEGPDEDDPAVKKSHSNLVRLARRELLLSDEEEDEDDNMAHTA